MELFVKISKVSQARIFQSSHTSQLTPQFRPC